MTLLRWIDHLSRLGRVTETTERVEEATIEAMRARRQRPYLGGHRLSAIADIPSDAKPVFIDRIGYIQHLDTGTLSEIAETANARTFVRLLPGQLVDPARPVASFDGTPSEETLAEIAKCFSLNDTRSFDQDPRFGASVLAEIASRALSAAVNDPGTAIDVISRAMRVLAVWTEPVKDSSILCPKLHVPALELDDLFTPIARDGAGIVEVGLRLQKAFETLSNFDKDGFPKAAKRHSKEALERAACVLQVESDLRRLRNAAKEVGRARRLQR